MKCTLENNFIKVSSIHAFGMEMNGRKWQGTANEFRHNYQGQEKDLELWGGAIAFKYRTEDPRLGRFFSVDPLANQFPWNSVYAFAENRVIDGMELEGKEWSKSSSFDPFTGITQVKFELKVQVVSFDKNYNNAEKSKNLLNGIQTQFAKTFSQFDKDTKTQYQSEVKFEFLDKDINDGSNTIKMTFQDVPGDEIGGSAGGAGLNTQKNEVTLPTSRNGLKRALNFVVRRGVHELGHTGGLPHPWEAKATQDVLQDPPAEIPLEPKKTVIKDNIMNSAANPAGKEMKSNSGTKATSQQLNQIGDNIDNDKKP